MSKSEREDLQRLIRQREKVLKSAAKQRSAELLADFENQMGQQYRFDQDEVWEAATVAADREVEKAQKIVGARCAQLGIPAAWAPSLDLNWHHRGYGNSIEDRRKELRQMARTQIEAIERKAITQIEIGCLQAQEQIAISGLGSDAARDFFASLPSVEALMPTLSFAELAGEAKPPIAEQLVTSNALRQRRYREKQAALRNGGKALRDGANNADDGGESS